MGAIALPPRKRARKIFLDVCENKASDRKLPLIPFVSSACYVIPRTAVAAIQVVQVVRCTRAHDPWGPTSKDQIAIF